MVLRPVLTDAELEALIAVGHDVLRVFPSTPGACVMMGALYAGRLRHLGHASVQLVAGNLIVDGVTVFGRSRLPTDFTRTDIDWDGHAWVRFGEYLADASLVMTAYGWEAPAALVRVVRPLRRSNQRLYIATPDAARQHDRLDYAPLHTFTDDEIATLYRGALTFIR